MSSSRFRRESSLENPAETAAKSRKARQEEALMYTRIERKRKQSPYARAKNKQKRRAQYDLERRNAEKAVALNISNVLIKLV